MARSDQPDLLTLAEAAEIARCSKATMRRRVATGAIKSSKHGRIVRVDLRDLTAFLNKQKRWR